MSHLTEVESTTCLVPIRGDLPLILRGKILLDRLFRACSVADEDLEGGELVVVERRVVTANAMGAGRCVTLALI